MMSGMRNSSALQNIGRRELNRNQLIASAAATLEVLEFIGAAGGPVTLSAVAQGTGKPKGTVHRMLSTLVNTGYLAQDRDASHYALTLKLWRLGAAAVGRLDMLKVARPWLERLMAETDETVHVSVTDPICTGLPCHRCTRNELRKGSGQIPLPPGAKQDAGAVAGVSAVEVDAGRNTLTLALPVPITASPSTMVAEAGTKLICTVSPLSSRSSLMAETVTSNESADAEVKVSTPVVMSKPTFAAVAAVSIACRMSSV